jgi:hypothetical protein
MVFERSCSRHRGYSVYSAEMATLNVDKISPGPELDALVAENVFGWKIVHKYQGALYGKKPDKLGRWRKTKVPAFSTNPVHAYSIDEQINERGLMDSYSKELAKITRATGIPSEWATPEQRCRAAIKTVRNRSRLRVVKK